MQPRVLNTEKWLGKLYSYYSIFFSCHVACYFEIVRETKIPMLLTIYNPYTYT